MIHKKGAQIFVNLCTMILKKGTFDFCKYTHRNSSNRVHWFFQMYGACLFLFSVSILCTIIVNCKLLGKKV